MTNDPKNEIPVLVERQRQVELALGEVSSTIRKLGDTLVGLQLSHEKLASFSITISSMQQQLVSIVETGRKSDEEFRVAISELREIISVSNSNKQIIDYELKDLRKNAEVFERHQEVVEDYLSAAKGAAWLGKIIWIVFGTIFLASIGGIFVRLNNAPSMDEYQNLQHRIEIIEQFERNIPTEPYKRKGNPSNVPTDDPKP